MEQKKNPFSHIRLVFRRSTPLTKVVVLAALVLSIAALLALRTAILHTESQSEALRSQAASLEQENAELTDKLENMDNVEGIVDIAGEELGLVDPNTIIFKPGQ